MLHGSTIEEYQAASSDNALIRLANLRFYSTVTVPTNENRNERSSKPIPTNTNPEQHAVAENEAKSTCGVCGAVFRTDVELAKHSKATGHKPFQCACEVRFVRKSIQTRHIKEQRGGTKQSCLLCTKTFPRKTKLYTHYLSCHKLKKEAVNAMYTGTAAANAQSLTWSGQPQDQAGPSKGPGFTSALVDLSPGWLSDRPVSVPSTAMSGTASACVSPMLVDDLEVGSFPR